jgi:hypothetical protein
VHAWPFKLIVRSYLTTCTGAVRTGSSEAASYSWECYKATDARPCSPYADCKVCSYTDGGRTSEARRETAATRSHATDGVMGGARTTARAMHGTAPRPPAASDWLLAVPAARPLTGPDRTSLPAAAFDTAAALLARALHALCPSAPHARGPYGLIMRLHIGVRCHLEVRTNHLFTLTTTNSR